jgi:mono/diheme cytochrome c family protein
MPGFGVRDSGFGVWRSGLGVRASRSGSTRGVRHKIRSVSDGSAWGWGPTRIKRCWRSRSSSVAFLIAAGVLAAGCRQDMHNQPKYRPLRASTLFVNGSSARPLVEGTIARGTLQEDVAFFTGKIGAADVKEFPFPIDEQVLDRGEERFNIYCTPCHDRTGSGRGMVVQRGYRQPPSFHIDRLRQADVGHFFDVMTNGFGAMPDYRAQISPRDRWNIVAYIRALQLSQHAATADIPGGDPAKLAKPAAPAGEKKH